MIGEFIELSNGVKMGASVSIGKGPSIGMKKSAVPYKATIIAKNSEVCQIEGNIGTSNFESVVNLNGKRYNIKSFGQGNTLESAKMIFNTVKDLVTNQNVLDNFLPQIYDDNGNLIGSCELVMEGSGSDAYPCLKFTINNVVLCVYELSHDATDLLYCIYNDQNQMVATVSKQTRVAHGHARYTIYSCDDGWFDYVALVTACFAISKNATDGSAGTFKVERKVTVQPGLLAKYNPTFIDQVKQKAGAGNLPENMSLVSDMVGVSKKAPEVNLYKSRLVVIIVAFVVLMILSFIFFK